MTPEVTAFCYRTKGERLAHIRCRAGLTIGSAAEKTGISSSELSRIENDRRKLTRKHIASFADAYGLSPGALEEILNFAPSSEFVRYARLHQAHDEQAEARAELPCYPSSVIAGVGLSVGHTDTITVPEGIIPGPLAYAVRMMEADAGYFFQPDTILVVNPQTKIVLGDLVINTCTWAPLVVSLARNAVGRLIGRAVGDQASFPPSTLLSSFHKVIAILPP